ncbi:MAG: polysaccharide biosynthesis tyrosine autokinase [Kiritimatiellae bacterium]|nr:polysaccharide biosynthesis tyrosine autokinase [Kiritimatiellia bacterium]
MTNNNAPVNQIDAQQQVQEDSVHFLDYWQILYSRKEIVIAVTLVMFFAGIFITRQMPSVYQANTLIEIQRETPSLDVYGQTYVRYDPIFLKTQFEIIRSDPIIEEVVRNLHLDDDLGDAYGWTGKYTPAMVFEKTVDVVQRSLTLDIVRDTQLVQITVKMSKPERPQGEAAKMATRIANEIANVFTIWNQNRTREVKEQGLETLKAEILDVDGLIAKQEDLLAEMRTKENITVVGELDAGTTSIRSQIVSLNSQLEKAELEANTKRYKYESFKKLSLSAAIATLTSSSTYGGGELLIPLVTELRQLEVTATANEKASFGPNHPEMLRIKAMMDQINTKIKAAIQDVTIAYKMDYDHSLEVVNQIKSRLANLEKQEKELSTGVSLDFERNLTELKTLKDRKIFLENNLMQEQMKLKASTTSVDIIQPARTDEVPAPVSPNFALNVILSLVAGLFFGIVIAIFVEYLDTTIKTVDDVEKYVGSTVVGVVPQQMRNLNDSHVRPSQKEIYRILRMNLKSSQKLGNGKKIVITSAGAGEGKSMSSFNLAYICAEIGEKVLLIDGDIHRPRQHHIMGKEQTPGLINIIVGEVSVDEAIHEEVFPNFDFIPAGRIASSNVYGLLDTDEARELLEELSARYDRIIIDAPPMVGVSDTAQVVRLGDGVLMVVQHRKYPRDLYSRARNTIVSMGGNLIGVVFNNVNTNRDYSSYYYKHQYYYYNGYGSYGYGYGGYSSYSSEESNDANARKRGRNRKS